MTALLFKEKANQIYSAIAQTWDNEIVPHLVDYIKIPNKSVQFDPEWKANGYMDEAMALIAAWCQRQPITGMQLEVAQFEGHTPLLLIEIAGQCDETVLLYGHMDKQPEMVGWDPDLGPWTPVLKGDQLYGRGGADDGYAVFAALTAIAALQAQDIPHGRCVVIIEASEESGSVDLPVYLRHFSDRIGIPSLVICLDTGCGNYDQMWSTTSLRGLMDGKLIIKVMEHGIHSGVGAGVVPSPLVVLRQLLHKVESDISHKILIDDLYVSIPKSFIKQAEDAALILGNHFYDMYPLKRGVHAVNRDISTLLLNRSWRPQLSITGLDGLPACANAGNVAIPDLAVMLSFRIPPSLDAKEAAESIKRALEVNPSPFGAIVHFAPMNVNNGWVSPSLSPWLEQANDVASRLFFDKPAAYWGEGGSIPFMGLLGEEYPNAQFLITGVLGPKSNAHGPNEFLPITYAKKITACVSSVLSAHYQQYT